MGINNFIRYSYTSLQYLVFILAPVFGYNIGLVGHFDLNGPDMSSFFLYSVVEFIFLVLVKKISKGISKVLIRFILVVLLILPIYYFGLVFYICLSKGSFNIIDFTISFLIFYLIVSTFGVIVGIFRGYIPE